MKLQPVISILLFSTILVACGNSGSTTATPISPAPTPPVDTKTPTTCTQVAGYDLPCIKTSIIGATIGEQNLVIANSSDSGNAQVFEPITLGSHKITPIGVKAGSSYVIAGINPMDETQYIGGINSNLTHTQSLTGIGIINFAGDYSQASYDVNGNPMASKFGTVNMALDGSAGTMTITGNNAFLLDGKVLVWDAQNGAFVYTDEATIAAGAVLLGTSESLGAYAGIENSNTVMGVFGGVAQ